MHKNPRTKDLPPRQSFKGFIAEGMAFEVPSWLDSSPARLGADTSLVPTDSAHRFEQVFPGRFGENGVIDENGEAKGHTEPIMTVVQNLTEAKRNASDVMMSMDGTQVACQEVINAERDVIRQRVNLLKALMVHGDANLCVESGVSPYDTSTSVEYRRMNLLDVSEPQGVEAVREKLKLFPIQSGMAWNGGKGLKWTDIGQLCQPSTQENLSPVLTNMIQEAVVHASRDGSTAALRNLVHRVGGVEFEYERNHPLGAVWQVPEASQTPRHVFTASVADGEEPPIHVTVLIGVLDINYCEAWHNPLINKFVQQVVATVGQRALTLMESSAGTGRDRLMWNTLKPTIRISQGQDVHVLTLAPFVNPDCCTVLHLFSEKGQEGICDLSQCTVESVPIGVFHVQAPLMQVYHCVGGNRRARFNEQELNYLHAKALGRTDAEHAISGIHGDDMPAGDELDFEDGGGPQAKSARISFSNWDVLVTSVWDTDADDSSEKTVVTLVNYPPAGTRYTPDHKALNTGVPDFVPSKKYSPWELRHMDPSGRAKQSSWDVLPKEGHMYFIPGLGQNAIKDRAWHVYLVETSPLQFETKAMMQKAKVIRDNIRRIYSSVWKQQSVNMWQYNLERNKSMPDGVDLSIHRYYVSEWGKVLQEWIHESMSKHAEGGDVPYLYCPNGKFLWPVLLSANSETGVPMTEAAIERWIAYSDEMYKNDIDSGDLQPFVSGHVKPPPNANMWPTPDASFEHQNMVYCVPGVAGSPGVHGVMKNLNFMFFMIDRSPGCEGGRKCQDESIRIRRELAMFFPNSPLETTEEEYYRTLQNTPPILERYTNLWREYIHDEIVGLAEDIGAPLYFKFSGRSGGYFFCHSVHNWRAVFPSEAEDAIRKAWESYSEERFTADQGSVRVDLDDVIPYRRGPGDAPSADVFVPGRRSGWGEEHQRPVAPPSYPRPQTPPNDPTLPAPYANYRRNKGRYFIPGVGSGDSFMDPRYNVYVIDSEGSKRLSELMINHAQSIRIELEDMFQGSWETMAHSTRNELTLYTNVQRDVMGHSNMRTRYEYATRWKQVLCDWIVEAYDVEEETFDSQDGYLYCEDLELWDDILDSEVLQDLLPAWKLHTTRLFEQNRPNLSCSGGQGMIALPPDRVRQPVLAALHAEPEISSTVAQLKERVASLEAKLDRSHQDANRDHLMQQLLARMK